MPATRRRFAASLAASIGVSIGAPVCASIGTSISACTATVAGLAGALWSGTAHAQPAAATRSEERRVPGFDRVQWQLVGELRIEQGAQERLLIEAEPAVLAHIVTEVQQRMLSIRFAPGRVETKLPIRVQLVVAELKVLALNGAGDVAIGPLRCNELRVLQAGSSELRLERLDAALLDLDLRGSGNVRIDAGAVATQRVALRGSGDYAAPHLQSRNAEVAIDGSGDALLAVSERLDARIRGSGDIRYRGRPQVRQQVSGAGEVVAD